MIIVKLEDGTYRANFWLFGHDLHKNFNNEKDALIFFENLKANYITDLHSIESCVEKYIYTVSSKKSQGSYTWEKHIFCVLKEFLARDNITSKDPITKVNGGHIEHFQMYLRLQRKLNPATVNRYFSTIKHFFKKLESWGMINKNPAKFISKMSENPKEKLVWTDENFYKVFERLNVEDKKLFLFLKLTGARLSSAARLKMGDVDFNSRLISLKSKKGARAQTKVYYFPIYDKLLNELSKIFEIRNSLEITHDYVFVSTDGSPVNSKNFAKRIRKALSKVDLTNNSGGVLSLHGLRTTMASVLHEGGMTITEIKGLLGHSSVTITEMYLKSDQTQVLTKINKIA